MKCKNCGTELEEGSIFCPECGKDVQIVPVYSEFEEDYFKKIFDEANSPEKKEEELKRKEEAELALKKREEEVRKKKIILIASIVGGCLLALILILCIVHGVKKSHRNSYDYQVKKAQEALADREYDDALAYYRKAIEIYEEKNDGYDIDLRLEMLEIYETMGDDDATLVMAQEVARYSPGNYTAYKTMVDIYAAQGNTDQIAKLYEDLCEDPDSVEQKTMDLFTDYVVTVPTFDTKAGDYDDYITVELSCEEDAEIYYTIDGSDPVKSGTLYEDPISIEDIGETTVKAVCKNALGIYSNVVEAVYNIDLAAPEMPTVTPDGGDFTEPTSITVEIPEDCTCYYTWDGTTPTSLSEICIGTLEVPEGNNVLSLILIDNRTDLPSDVYRGRFSYYPNGQ